jgi:hypothetical protein
MRSEPSSSAGFGGRVPALAGRKDRIDGALLGARTEDPLRPHVQLVLERGDRFVALSEFLVQSEHERLQLVDVSRKVGRDRHAHEKQ